MRPAMSAFIAMVGGLIFTLVGVQASSEASVSGAAGESGARPGVVVFYVSPRGNDAWSGRLSDPNATDGPFATLERARDAIRALRWTQKLQIPVRVTIRGGTYYLDSPLEFGPEDSGTEQASVIYAAAAGEKVVLSGGRRLETGRWGEVNGRKAWVVDIAEVKAGTWRFRQLFVNGERRPRTRLPKQGEYRIESLPGYMGDFLRSPTKQFVYAPGNIVPGWRNLQDVEIVGITRWLDNRLPIESVDAKTRTVTFDRPSLFALVSGSQPGVYWVENVFEALDTPGQWYLDRPRGELCYLPRPGEEMPSAEIVAPRLTQVVRVVGRPGAPVHDLRLEGLIFAHTEWQPPADYASSLQAGIEVPGALLFDYAERCAVTGGGIEHIGNYGVEVNVGCADIEIARNRITDVGAGGIRIGHFFSWETDGSGQMTERGLRRKAAMPQGPHSRRITVADNEIAHGGRFTPEAVGVFVGDNADNKVIHNHIYDLFYSGISLGSVQDFGPGEARGNIIEYNHVHDIGQGVLSDLAGIYTCSTPGSRIAYNVVHDVSRRDYGGWGIYPDEGSHDMSIQKNLVYRCQDGALFAHHNHDITAENNIFAFNRTAQIERGGIGGFELTCRRNLVYYLEGKAVGDYGSGRPARDICAFDRNLYWNASGKPVLFADKSFSQWQATGQDADSLIADPLFVDPAHGDFTLRPGSPASQIGFEPWDLSTVGPRPPSMTPLIAAPATGPLRVNKENPRYFTDGTKMPDGSLRAVYLTGSHHWNNLQDSAKLGKPLTEKFDYDGYLRLLARLNHNYIRMWSWEVGENDVYYDPAPWVRTGPGTAADGKLKFDLQQFNPEYFQRLRSRVIAARNRGIYVGVMLFQGWSIYSHGYGNPWLVHPFNEANNINGVNGDPDKDGEGKEVHTLQVPAVTRLQEAYVRKVIDTLNDLDNVLYEITNETAIFSKDWQHHIVRFVQEYEATKPRQHPVGMTAFDSGREGSMAALLESPADWISPQNDGVSGDYQNDPPVADGRKVIISDTDHLWGVGGDRVWVWKSFTRGHNPIYMDPLRKQEWFSISEADMEGARKAMGDTRRFAERINLAAMKPRSELSSTGYCLANAGVEYLVYQPKSGENFSIELKAGTYRYEWFNPMKGAAADTGRLEATDDRQQFKSPFEGDAVLYLKAQ